MKLCDDKNMKLSVNSNNNLLKELTYKNANNKLKSNIIY